MYVDTNGRARDHYRAIAKRLRSCACWPVSTRDPTEWRAAAPDLSLIQRGLPK
jgi:hypothetical protein